MEFLKSCARIFKYNKSPPSSPKKESNTSSNSNGSSSTKDDNLEQQSNENGASLTNSSTSTTTISLNTSNNNNNNNVYNNNNQQENNNNNQKKETRKIQIDKDELFSIDFSSISKSKEELIDCSVVIFEESGIINHFNVNREILASYLSKVRESYRDNPFHSFNHAVTVTQMIFLIIIKTQLLNILTPIEKLAILIASVCHDLDHPGLNNRFQINIKSPLALQYNNKSVLENHHLHTCLQILHNDEAGKGLLSKLTDSDRELLFEKVKVLILSTDMENHFVYKEKFDQIIPVFDWENKEHRELLLIMLLKSADISNELRSWDVSSKWANALMQEFFNQSDLEKENNLPLTPFMVREKVVLNSTQVSFIDKFLLPTYQALQIILPPLSVFIERINQNRKSWESYTVS